MAEMCRKLLLFLLILGVFVENGFGVKCDFCQRDFSHINRHLWRCKERLRRDVTIATLPTVEESYRTQGTSNIQSNNEQTVINSENAGNVSDNLLQSSHQHDPNDHCCHPFQCYCGRYFDSLRGLNVHRRSCFITEQPNLSDLFVNEQFDENGVIEETTNNVIDNLPKVLLKTGVKLPKTNEEWECANNYFKINLDYTTEISDINLSIRTFNDVVYNYFDEACGNVNQQEHRNEFDSKYLSYSKSKLKKCLYELKRTQPTNINEIKYVSRLLRNKLDKSRNANNFDHNDKIKQNYWKYCKNIFEVSESPAPDFDEKVCSDYFKGVLKENNRSRSFTLPSWMKNLEDPKKVFNLGNPTYREVNKIIMKMKAAGSPCPFDHVSVIMLQKCPILRTQVWKIIMYCWENKHFPSEWKNGATILIHKKGLTNDPSNFRPITLEPVLSKVMTSLMRNRIFTFVVENCYIETNLQKGFWSDLSGTIEHTELLSHILKHAKLKQRQCVVTLFDLKNAFGEVHHQLIRKVLLYHKVPDDVIDLVSNLYDSYHISILTKEYQTAPIRVDRGVLQGDSLSPLLFNLCINTLIVAIKNEKVACLGYVYDISSSPRHWFQFADDTAIVTALEGDNQLLCNVFSKWTRWANLIIRIDKCHTFGMKKESTSALQYQPKIRVNGEQIPPLDPDESFIYLGKQFNFKMDIENIKNDIVTKVTDTITKIDLLPLSPLNKISIVQTYMFSKLRWNFSIYELTETWVVQNIDNLISKYVRKWLQLPVSANAEHLSFSVQKLGINFKFAKFVYNKCKLSVRRILSQSNNSEIRNLYKITENGNINHDSLINSASRSCPDLEKKKLASKIDKNFSKIEHQKIWNNFMELKEQNVIIKHVLSQCPAKVISMWQSLMRNLPGNIFCFTRKALIFCLPNNSNLFRWKLVDTNTCPNCSKTETQLHVLSNCVNSLGRYKWRHDSILNSILIRLSNCNIESFKVYADCPGTEQKYKCPSDLFTNKRPDLVVVIDKRVIVLELTVCFDTNTTKSRDYKKLRYNNLKDELVIACDTFEVIYLEFTCLGFISKDSYSSFCKFLKDLDLNVDRTVYKCMETAIRASYYIFCRRHKLWIDTKLLCFY